MVEGHCAKRYADDARQKCCGKRVVEIIWRGDPQNQSNVERSFRTRFIAAACPDQLIHVSGRETLFPS